MPTSSPTFDGSGNSYPVSPIRCPGLRHIRMMTPPSIYLICQHNSTCVPMLWLLNTTHVQNIQVKFQAPSQPSSPLPKSASRSTHNASHLNTLSQLGFTSMEQSIEPTYKKLEQLGNLMPCVWNNIDMQGLGISFKSLDTPSRHFTSKMLHGWLNTGHQRAKITKDPLSSLCPCCQAPDETYEHILWCTAPMVVTARTEALKKISKLDKRGSTTWRVLHQALKNWLKDGDKMQNPCLDNYMMMAGHRKLLETALKNQAKIGWNYAIRGYLSTSWVDSEQYVNRQPHDGIRQTWLCTIIKTVWRFNKTMWTHRNLLPPLHNHTTTRAQGECRQFSNPLPI
jgi:hypothetical protein